MFNRDAHSRIQNLHPYAFLFYVLVCLIGFVVPEIALAGIHTDAAQYEPQQPIIVYCDESAVGVHMYDVTEGVNGMAEFGGTIGWFGCADTFTQVPYGVNIGHTYTLVELDTGTNCDGLDYDMCKSQAYYLAETTFSVVEALSGGGGGGGGFAPRLSMDKNTHYPDDLITVQCTYSSSGLRLYDVTQSPYLNVGRYDCINSVASFSFGGDVGHSYALLEVGQGEQCNESYESCRASGSFVAEVSFSVVVAPPEVTTGWSSYRPEAFVSTPKDGAVFSRKGVISYRAADQNDRGGLEERARLGLIEKPVNVYYTENLPEWDHTLTPLEDMVLIAKDQPASGTYEWDIKGLVPGVFYRIVVTAVDAVGNVGQDVSDFFTVDFESPEFTVTVDPPVTRKEPVTITVVSSKNLVGAPTTTITQQGGKPVVIELEGSGKEFTGTYEIVPGYDGIATVAVEGVDPVGNVGSTIVSGGTFAVGINPPPKPVITSPKTGLVTASSTVGITGTTRPDTVVILKLNGVVIANATPDAAGTYAFASTTLSADTRRGINILSVAAKDLAGVTGEEASVEIKYNLPPTVALAGPKAEAVVGSQVAIQATSSDPNLDPLLFTYQIMSKALYNSATTSSSWITIAERVPSSRFTWDSTEVDDGSYFIRVIADDGIEQVVTVPVLVTIKNTLPYFRFEDGRKTVTGTSTATIRGRAIAPDTVSPQPVILNADYSLDDGKTWVPIKFTSGSSTPQAMFEITLTGLHEGVQGIRWRVRDSRLLSGRASHPVVFDTAAPKPPVTTTPKSDIVFSDSADANSVRKGVQMTFAGRAESESTVTLSLGSTTRSIKTAPDGAFSFRDVDIEVRGTYRAVLTARDVVGNVSDESIIEFTYDNAPLVSITRPKNLRALNGVSAVTWRANDPDGDPLTQTTLSFRMGSGRFTKLPIEAGTTSYSLNVSEFAESRAYELRLEASDGIVSSTDVVRFAVDRTPPALKSLTLTRMILGAADHVRGSGTATDSLSGIEYVEYAIAEPGADPTGLEWYTAVVSRGFLSDSAVFTFDHPVKLQDGAYRLHVRAVDAAGNVSPVESRNIRVDASPPHIGSFQAKAVGVVLPPNQDGSIVVYGNSPATFSISLEGDTDSAMLTVGTRDIVLTKNVASGLWEASLPTDQSQAQLLIKAEDYAHNATQQVPIGELRTIPRGQVRVQEGGGLSTLPGATIEVLVLDERGVYVPLSTPSFSRDNLPVTDENGSYVLALPQGIYRVIARKDGYATAELPVSLEAAGIVSESFTTTKLSKMGSVLQTISEFFGQ